MLPGWAAGHAWLKHFQWVAVAAVGVGIPIILLKGVVSLRHLVLDINILMTVAVAGALSNHRAATLTWVSVKCTSFLDL